MKKFQYRHKIIAGEWEFDQSLPENQRGNAGPRG